MKQKTNITPLPKIDIKKEKESPSLVSSLSPREIVSELDRYVIGQNAAKGLWQLHLEIGGEDKL